jgi:hypothetical protein
LLSGNSGKSSFRRGTTAERLLCNLLWMYKFDQEEREDAPLHN